VAHSPASSNALDHVTVESDKLRLSGTQPSGRGRPRSQYTVEQIPFDFSASASPSGEVADESSLDDQVRIAAADYQLQMQAYALAVGALAPSLLTEGSTIASTLHFLEPNREYHLTAELLSPEACRQAIDEAMLQIISSSEPPQFPVHTATHCRMCNFLGICPAGRDFVWALRRGSISQGDSNTEVDTEN
jgi:hypothetical protein